MISPWPDDAGGARPYGRSMSVLAPPTPLLPPPLPPAIVPSRRRAGRWWRIAVAAAVLVAAVVLDPSALGVVILLFVVVVPFERLFPRHPQPFRRPALGTDLAYGLLQPLLAPVGLALGIVVAVASLAWLPGLALRPLVELMPGAVRTAAGVLLFDLVTYWVHRWSHEVPFLWRFHRVHHSTEHLDWVSGLRMHPFDGALLAPPFVFLLAAGFGPELAGVLAVVQVVIGLFLHANVRWRLRVLHRVVITPEFHHWHHADEPDAHSTNYSVLLPIWDLAFGTWFMPRHRRPSRYGVTPALPTGIVAQLRQPLRGLPGPRWVLRHPLLATRRTAAATRRGLHQIARSTTRRTRSTA